MTRSRGLTLVELCIGLVIVSMIAMALAGFSLSYAQYWKATEDKQHIQVISEQSRGVIAPIIDSARALSVMTRDGPTIFLWQSDSYLGTADGKAQLAEMAVIQFNSELNSILYYQANLSADLSSNPLASQQLTYADMKDPNVAALFQAQVSMLKPTRTLLGPGRSVADDIDVSRVQDVTFTLTNNSGLPGVRMNATVIRGDTEKEIVEFFAVRAPTTRP